MRSSALAPLSGSGFCSFLRLQVSPCNASSSSTPSPHWRHLALDSVGLLVVAGQPSAGSPQVAPHPDSASQQPQCSGQEACGGRRCCGPPGRVVAACPPALRPAGFRIAVACGEPTWRNVFATSGGASLGLSVAVPLGSCAFCSSVVLEPCSAITAAFLTLAARARLPPAAPSE